MKFLKWLTLFLVLAVALGAGGVYLLAERAVNTPAKEGDASEVEVKVPPGTSARALGPLLAREGLIADARVWRYFLWKRGHLDAKAGRFLLKRDMAMPALAAALEGPPLPEDQPFVVVEGWRLRDTD